jgi:ATP-dependent protease ClpP protease subunit
MSKKINKFWNIVSVGADEAEITMYGDVCESQPIDWWTGEPVPGFFITPEGFLEDLAVVKNKSKITIKLNSCGGDLYTGIAIHNELKGLQGHKTVIVEGIAASAASVIMCAGDEVQVYPGSLIMIHGVAGVLFDYVTIADLKLAIKGFEAAEKAIAEIYSEKTGDESGHLRAMMTRESWFVGQEAVEAGFADTLLKGSSPDMSLSADKKILLVAGVRHDVSGFKNMPGNIPVYNINNRKRGMEMFRKRKKVKNAIEEDIQELEQDIQDVEQTVEDLEETVTGLESEIEDLKEEIESLKEDLAQAVEAKKTAVKAERKRIQDIEEIAAGIGNEELVFNAKYGDKACTAKDLSFIAVQQQAKLGAAYLNNAKLDFDASNAGDIGADPNGGGEIELTPDQIMKNAKAEVKNLLGINKKED